MCRIPPSCCQSCNDQTGALMKEMFSNVPDNTPAVVVVNENSRAVTVLEVGQITLDHSLRGSGSCERYPSTSLL